MFVQCEAQPPSHLHVRSKPLTLALFATLVNFPRAELDSGPTDQLQVRSRQT